MDEQVKRWRDDTPGCANRTHLNNAGASLMPRVVTDAVVQYLARESEIGGYEATDEAAARITEAYASVARLVGAEPRNIAVVENATVGFAQATSAIDFRQSDIIVTSQADYVSNQLLFLSLAKRNGVTVLRAAELPEGGVDPQSVAALAKNPRCKMVALSWIPTNSGLVQDVAGVGQVCAKIGVPYLIDACQAVGQLPVDVQQLKCDYLSTASRKFLRGPRGTGFLYVSDRALARGDYPLFVDMRGAQWLDADRFELVPDARRFENWEFAYGLILGMGAAARYALAIGLPEIQRRARDLAAYARERLAAVAGVRVLDRGRELCAIVTAEVSGWDARELSGRLRQRGINTSASLREYAVIDMAAKGVETALRVSPHYFNTRNEVDQAVQAIAELVARGPGRD